MKATGTVYLTHAAGLAHVTPPGHPERAARLTAVNKALSRPEFDRLVRRDAPPGAMSDILRAHPQAHLDAIIRSVPNQGWVQIDADTMLSPGSMEAALRAVGGVTAAVDSVVAGTVRNGFVAMRPPGHHAERARAMGFCLFGQVAIGALRALSHHGLDRVAVLDFDVHHGNGTQDILWHEPGAMFVSSHQMPLYPGSGGADEQGAHGQIINLPLAPGSGGAAMRAAWAPALERVAAFGPDLILVSAGFDAHAADPLASLTWTAEDFRWLAEAICDVAQLTCAGRVVSSLEGGYDLDALGESAAAFVRVLMERSE